MSIQMLFYFSHKLTCCCIHEKSAKSSIFINCYYKCNKRFFPLYSIMQLYPFLLVVYVYKVQLDLKVKLHLINLYFSILRQDSLERTSFKLQCSLFILFFLFSEAFISNLNQVHKAIIQLQNWYQMMLISHTCIIFILCRLLQSLQQADFHVHTSYSSFG